MNVLGDEVKEVESFVIVYKYKDRFTSPFARTLRVITKMFGNFWSNVVILVNFWSFNPLHVQVRKKMYHPQNSLKAATAFLLFLMVLKVLIAVPSLMWKTSITICCKCYHMYLTKSHTCDSLSNQGL